MVFYTKPTVIRSAYGTNNTRRLNTAKKNSSQNKLQCD